MIEITEIEVTGTTRDGAFRGKIALHAGLNVVSAKNAYGKSLAITAIPWCLGLEPMFGLTNNDPSRFPSAVRDVITLGDVADAEVLSSCAYIKLRRGDGATIGLRRQIKGGDLEVVEVEEECGDNPPRLSRMQARRQTMADESAGLQRFLYEWMGIPRVPVMTNKGTRAELYLENAAPLFFIDQTEGWTDLQALQVYRYQLQDVSEVAVEYLLGAQRALESRLERQERASTDARLKGEAIQLGQRISELCLAQGWTINWSTQGAPDAIAKRWASRTLSETIRDEFNMDVVAERKRVDKRVALLRASMASTPKGDGDLSPASQASQEVVELKTKRHEVRSSLRETRMQLADQRTLLATIEHRSHSSKDVLRLKKEGIGRLDRVECPTCHRDLDPATFDLTLQSTESVQAHIDALQKQRALMLDNIASLEGEMARLQHETSMIDERLIAAERAMGTVNQARSTTRERLAKVAMDLASAERESDSLARFTKQVSEIETDLKRWLTEVHEWTEAEEDSSDLLRRIAVFEEKLRAQLVALGHSAVNEANARGVRLDDRYIPYVGPRRLRSLGSASDHPRLVAAYVLALAEASRSLVGNHPGIVVLDEPQQQNPDADHVELMLRFLELEARETSTQVIVTTFLKPNDVERLVKANVSAIELQGSQFLQPTKVVG